MIPVIKKVNSTDKQYMFVHFNANNINMDGLYPKAQGVVTNIKRSWKLTSNQKL